MATRHADTVLKYFIRPDGSSIHIGSFNPETGEFIESLAGQGFSPSSSWTRGQGWALYGFVLSYIHTGQTKYLDAAKRVANYFIANTVQDPIPPSDFRGASLALKDSSAAAIAACGMIEIAKNVDAYEKHIYEAAAFRMVKALSEQCTDWTENEDALLTNGCSLYGGEQLSLIYGDYFFLEAILKLRGEEFLMW